MIFEVPVIGYKNSYHSRVFTTREECEREYELAILRQAMRAISVWLPKALEEFEAGNIRAAHVSVHLAADWLPKHA